ncbi:MAG: threonine synthase [Candidatus Bathyarchaeia archaeon]
MFSVRCLVCGSISQMRIESMRCTLCGGSVECVIDVEGLRSSRFTGPFSFWRYKTMLPKVKNTLSLGEGGTPLHKARRLAKQLGISNLYLKDETRNPTNSFRDRCAALMVSHALDLGAKAIVCATNGNLGASLAAYSAKFGIPCHILVPKNVDLGKLAQMIIYDATIEEYGEIVDDSLAKAEEIAKETGWYQGSAELNPLAIEALKTIAYEVYEQFGVPDWFIIPMGSGGTLYAIWKGFKELQAAGMVKETPRMVGVQAEGCSPIVNAYIQNTADPFLKAKPFTHALAILVRNPSHGRAALKAIKESGGLATSVSDEEIIQAEQEIARFEGLFSEPASAATIAALNKLIKQSIVDSHSSVVCLITGSGLKATDILQALTKKRKATLIGLEFSTKEKILRILSEGDTYGYDLWKKLGRTMTRGAIYQHLNELSNKGLISSYEVKGKKFFKITSRGRRVLAAIDELKILI